MGLRLALRYENMSSELTNLLPNERIRAFRRDYFFRLFTVVVLVVAVAIGVHGALLAPSYLYLHQTVSLDRLRLSELSDTLAASEEAEMQARLTRLKSDSERLLALSSSPSATKVIRALLEVPHAGIIVTAISFKSPSPDGRLTITGMAKTRESLRQYHLALSSLTFAKSAELPLSAYAKESDIPFTITLTGPLTP